MSGERRPTPPNDARRANQPGPRLARFLPSESAAFNDSSARRQQNNQSIRESGTSETRTSETRTSETRTSTSESNIETTSTSTEIVTYEERDMKSSTLSVTLSVQAANLTIEWMVTGTSERLNIVVDLDKWIAVVEGRLVWNGKGGFIAECQTGTTPAINGTFLVVSIRSVRGVEYVETRLDLNDYFIYSDIDGFEPIKPDPELVHFMTSSSWMNVRVMAQANLHLLVSNPIFRKAVSNVARRATERATKRANEERKTVMEEMMRQTLERLSSIKEESEVYIAREVTVFIKSMAKSAKLYTELTNFTLMEMNEEITYDGFEGLLPPPKTHMFPWGWP
ncbi:hypothetical protein C8R45DRAFT_1133277 [Mycena sanguinolenta]|nr:hypothetical protein C8R45DRAFT_1133277 [Mycena sanguinolenta]